MSNERQSIVPDTAARSPWSLHNDAGKVQLLPPSGPVGGTVKLAGSKSLTNRALIIAALAEGTSRIDGVLRSDDAYWCIQCLTKLGVHVTVDDAAAVIEGVGGRWPQAGGELYVGAAGTVARFLPPALAAGRGSWTVRGSRRMRERPIAPLLDALSQLGAVITPEDAAHPLPYRLEANGLKGGEAALPGSASSQFVSGLLIAAPYAASPLTIRVEGGIVQRDYVELTLDMMRAFGIRPEVSDDGSTMIVPTGRYTARNVSLEPDISTCGYFWALAALTGGTVRTEGIDVRSTRQPDAELLDALERMGCTVVREASYAQVRGPAGGRLKGGFTLDMGRWSDQTLTMAALAVFADGPITLTGAGHIRHHECDRLAAICTELRKLGIRADEHPDGLTVHPGVPSPAVLDPHDDHRMAMALALIGTKVSGITILDPGCVSKTCPDYFERLAALGVGVAFDKGRN